MARGWDSKSVEQQIEDAVAELNQSSSRGAASDEIEWRRKREGLLLQRSRILQEIESARNPRYQEMLREMLSHVEKELEPPA